MAPVPSEEPDIRCARERAKVVIPLTPEEQGIYDCLGPEVVRVTVCPDYAALRAEGGADAGIDPGVFELELDGERVDAEPAVTLRGIPLGEELTAERLSNLDQ